MPMFLIDCILLFKYEYFHRKPCRSVKNDNRMTTGETNYGCKLGETQNE